MLQKQSKILFAVIAVMVLTMMGIASCDNGCEQMRESFMHINIISTTSRAMRSLNIDAHGRRDGWPMSDSTTLQYSTISLTKFDNIDLELNPNDSLVTFVFRCVYSDYGDKFTANDTVRIVYAANGRFLDMECGCTVDYTIQQVTTTHSLLEEVKITDPEIHTESGINLEFTY